MIRIAAIDSSSLIGLAMVDGLQWLPKLLGTVFLPESFRQEVLPDKAARGKEAIAAGWVNVWSEIIEPLSEIDSFGTGGV